MIGTFRIISEGSIAAGIRRIQAVTARGAEEYLYSQADELTAIKELLNGSNTEAALRKLIEENSELKKQVKDAEELRKNELIKQLNGQPQDHNGIKLFIPAESIAPALAKEVAFGLKALRPDEDIAFVAGSVEGPKATLTLLLSDSLVEKGLNAGNLVREAAKLIQGGGGGQPGFATAGGKNPSGLSDALNKLKELLRLP